MYQGSCEELFALLDDAPFLLTSPSLYILLPHLLQPLHILLFPKIHLQKPVIPAVVLSNTLSCRSGQEKTRPRLLQLLFALNANQKPSSDFVKPHIEKPHIHQ